MLNKRRFGSISIKNYLPDTDHWLISNLAQLALRFASADQVFRTGTRFCAPTKSSRTEDTEGTEDFLGLAFGPGRSGTGVRVLRGMFISLEAELSPPRFGQWSPIKQLPKTSMPSVSSVRCPLFRYRPWRRTSNFVTPPKGVFGSI
jgi:hypothetical protein